MGVSDGFSEDEGSIVLVELKKVPPGGGGGGGGINNGRPDRDICSGRNVVSAPAETGTVTAGLSETVCIGVTKIGCTPSVTEEDERVDEEVLVEVEVPEEVTGTACSVRILRSLDADERISLRDVLGGAAVT